MAESSSSYLPITTLIHLLGNAKLDSSNYINWRDQVEPLLKIQKFFGYIDGTNPAPSPTITGADNKVEPNLSYALWYEQDQLLRSLLLSTLTDEAKSHIVGQSSSSAVWKALEAAFQHSSKIRELSLKDDLHLLKRGARTVAEYGRHFKSVCDQLAAIGRPLDETDKSHLFLCGLGAEYTSFIASQMSISPFPRLHELVHAAESFSLLRKSIETSPTPPAAFVANSSRLACWFYHTLQFREVIKCSSLIDGALTSIVGAFKLH